MMESEPVRAAALTIAAQIAGPRKDGETDADYSKRIAKAGARLLANYERALTPSPRKKAAEPVA